jgi:hypothetical protein
MIDVLPKIKLFHASTSRFVDAQQLTDPRICDYYPKAVLAIETARPPLAPSRSACFFAAEASNIALRFKLGQEKSAAPIYLYEVEMPDSWRAPFALVHAIGEAIAGNDRDVGDAVAEYWAPEKSWNYFERFGPRMKIVSQVDHPRLNEWALQARYDTDFDAANRLCHLRKAP